MDPLFAEILEGKVVYGLPAGQSFTLATLSDAHTRALMLGVPMHAQITRLDFGLTAPPDAPNSRYKVAIHWRVDSATIPPHGIPTPPPDVTPEATTEQPTGQESPA